MAARSVQAACADIERLWAAPRAGLGVWPTPLQQLCGPSERQLWIKRDDRSGLGRGGAKARKIDLILGHMLARGYDELPVLRAHSTSQIFVLCTRRSARTR